MEDWELVVGAIVGSRLVSALDFGDAVRSFRSLIGTAGIVDGVTSTGSLAFVVVLMEDSILSFGALVGGS